MVRPESVRGPASRAFLAENISHQAPGFLRFASYRTGQTSSGMFCELWTMTPSPYILQHARVRVSRLEVPSGPWRRAAVGGPERPQGQLVGARPSPGLLTWGCSLCGPRFPGQRRRGGTGGAPAPPVSLRLAAGWDQPLPGSFLLQPGI